jgi:hypothetical protein
MQELLSIYTGSLAAKLSGMECHACQDFAGGRADERA